MPSNVAGVTVDQVSSPKTLIIETSSKVGLVAVAEGTHVLAVRTLYEARRHARDLAPSVRDLFLEVVWQPIDVDAVLVSMGPGSYTGLRVGIMSAKTFAYAAGCRLLGVESFAAIADQAPQDLENVDVFADAQQDRVYLQRFARSESSKHLQPQSRLTIVRFDQWLDCPDKPEGAMGPGLHGKEERLPQEVRLIDPSSWDITADSLLSLGLRRYTRGKSDDVFGMEPLYLRPSAAEEQWTKHTPDVHP